MTYFLQLLITGVSVGCIYALAALGFVLIYKSSRVINFAQGECWLSARLRFTALRFGWG